MARSQKALAWEHRIRSDLATELTGYEGEASPSEAVDKSTRRAGECRNADLR